MAAGDFVGTLQAVCPPTDSEASAKVGVIRGGSTVPEAIPCRVFRNGVIQYADYVFEIGVHTGGINVILGFTAGSTGNVEFGVAVRHLDADADDLASAFTYAYEDDTGPVGAGSVASEPVYHTQDLTIAEADDITAGDCMLVRVRRDATAATDTCQADVNLFSVQVESSG